MKRLLKYHGLTILWALIIFVLCSVKFGDSLTHEPMFFPGFDKLVHCGLLFVLVTFWCNGIIRQQNTGPVTYKYAAIVIVLSIAYGGLIEILQLTIFTWRSGEWSDFFADCVGACMGIFCVLVTGKAISHEKN
jgi:VanZ family protein